MLHNLTRFAALALLIACPAWTGCSKGHHHPAKPERSAELDKFNDWVGTWEGEWEACVPSHDEPMKGKSRNEFSWEADQRILVERFSMDMGEMGQMSGLGLYTYSPKAKKFRQYYIDDWDGASHGTMRYCDECDKWTMKGESSSPMHGHTKYKCTSWKVDQDTMKFEYSERPYWCPKTMFRVCGTMHRK